MIAGDDLVLFERGLRHATERASGPALDAALDQLGWPEALHADPRVAVSILFRLQGAANAGSSALERVLLGALGADGGAVLLPPLGAWLPPGRLEGDHLVVNGLGTAAWEGGGTAVIAAATGSGDVVVAVAAAGEHFTVRRIEGIDPAFGLVEVRGTVAGPAAHPADWAAAVTLGQLALGHELVGAARTMLDLARAHALGRIQFGRPIAAFQAVRHRLAETMVALEAADAALDAAWDDGSGAASAIAKALAGRGARVAARHCQQVLAGIGFTTEHPFHRYLHRVLVLDQLLGASRTLTADLGDRMLRSRRLPDLLPL